MPDKTIKPKSRRTPEYRPDVFVQVTPPPGNPNEHETHLSGSFAQAGYYPGGGMFGFRQEIVD